MSNLATIKMFLIFVEMRHPQKYGGGRTEIIRKSKYRKNSDSRDISAQALLQQCNSILMRGVFLVKSKTFYHDFWQLIVTVITPETDGEFRQNHFKSRHFIPELFKQPFKPKMSKSVLVNIPRYTAQEKRTWRDKEVGRK
jgi:hypothetical protein